MPDMNSEQILEVLGVIVSFMMYLAPVSSFVDMCKKKSTEGYQLWAPHVISLFNTTFVLYYAILKDDRRHVLDVILISIKALGVLIQASYVIIFISFSPKSCQVSRIFQLISMVVIVGSIIDLTSLIHGVHERRTFVGWLSAAFSICGFGESSYQMIQAVMTKDMASISWFSSLISTMNAIIWFWNGLLVKDVIMATPNAIGIIVGASQILCYILCNKKGADNNVEINPI